MTRSLSHRKVCLLALLLVLPLWAAPAAMQSPARATRAIALEDIVGWKTIGATAVSNDGQWFGYRYGASEGDAQVVVRHTSSERELKFDIGEPSASQIGDAPPAPPAPPGPGGAAAGAAAAVQFSDDSKWIAFTTYPKHAEVERLR